MTLTMRKLWHVCALGALLLACPRPSQAQTFISPLVGFNFGGDAGCPTISNCEDKNLNLGVSFGALGPLFGVEEEIAYARDFFGESPDQSTTVLTVMTNLVVGPNLKVVRPYALVGVGLIKSRVEFTRASLLSSTNNSFGWDVGGGVFVPLGRHLGVRGDVRYFHAFQDLELAGLTLSSTKLDFGRAAGALVFSF